VIKVGADVNSREGGTGTLFKNELDVAIKSKNCFLMKVCGIGTEEMQGQMTASAPQGQID
jgi:hypothetical protein